MANTKSTKAPAQQKDQLPAAAGDYDAYAGQGLENVGSEDILVPFLALLQPLSPQCQEEDTEARPGMLFNTVTEELYSGKDGVEFVAACTEHEYTEWVPRDQGGGLVARYAPNDAVVQKAIAESEEFGKYATPAGNDLVETFKVYGVICEDAAPSEFAVIAFTSTKIKAYKAWMTKIRMLNHRKLGLNGPPPLFAFRFRIRTKKESNRKGEFYNLVVSPAEDTLAASLIPPNDDRFQSAASIREMVHSGAARADDASQAKTTVVDGADAGPAPSGEGEGDDIPF